MTIKQSGFEKLQAELSHGEESEDNIKTKLEELGWEVEKTHKTAIHDFLIKKDGVIYSVELKTRTCSHSFYPTTMIGGNKLAEAWQKWYKEGIETLFLFQYTDGLYYVSVLSGEAPRKDYKAGRWDRGGIDKKKGWIYYNTDKLININNL